MNQIDLLRTLFTSKKSLIILTIVYIIIVITVLVIIWMSNPVSDISKYTEYDETVKNNEMIKYYAEEIQKIKINSTIDEFKEYISSDYLYYSGTTIEQAFERLQETKTSFTIYSYDVYKLENGNIYSLSLPSSTGNLKINIIEDDYPYNFCIAYDNFVRYVATPKIAITDSASVKIIGECKTLNYIEYEIEVTNTSDSEIDVDLSNSLNAYITLKDDSKVYLDLVQINQTKENIKKGETAKLKLRFNIGISNQGNIVSFSMSKIFNGTSFEKVTLNI